MTQEERRVYLIRDLLEETGTQAGAIPAQEQAPRDLLRTLMNVRPPRPIRRRRGDHGRSGAGHQQLYHLPGRL